MYLMNELGILAGPVLRQRPPTYLVSMERLIL